MCNRRLPAEWEQQSGVMLVWPHVHGDWKDNLNDVEKTYLTIVTAICPHEAVVIVCFDDAHRAHVTQLINTHESSTGTVDNNLRFIIAPSNDSWVRDTGPLTVIENTVLENIEDDSGGDNFIGSVRNDSAKKNNLCLLDFTFNGWGEKYPSAFDNEITAHVTRANLFGKNPVLQHPLILEGGSIESDGQGTLLTTTSCLSNPNRNPGLTREDIEDILRTQLGAKRILWLNHGHLAGDDTDGHIDTLARFCSHDTIAYTHCNDTTDIHYESLTAMAKELADFKTVDGKPYQLQPLPIPAAIHNDHGERLPANYTNFLIINEAVLVPTYNDPNDLTALQALETCFPERKIIGIDCRSILQQFGSLHCATMQFPLGVLN